MNATLARLHSFDPAALSFADLTGPRQRAGRQVERWSKQYRASETEKIEEMEAADRLASAHLPPPGPVRLVHGDYRLDNIILVTARGRSILAVLDWELSTWAIRLADLAYHLMAVRACRRRRPAPASARC